MQGRRLRLQSAVREPLPAIVVLLSLPHVLEVDCEERTFVRTVQSVDAVSGLAAVLILWRFFGLGAAAGVYGRL